MPHTSLPPFPRKWFAHGRMVDATSFVIILLFMLPVVSALAWTSAAQAQEATPSISETALTSTANPDGSVTFTALVTTSDRTLPVGSVKFVDETTEQLVGVVDALSAIIRVPPLPAGPHSIRAYYSGSPGYFPYVTEPSVSTTLIYRSLAAPRIDLVTSQNGSPGSQLVTLTVRVTAPGMTPRGLVRFREGERVLATQTLDSDGEAAFITSALEEGSHRIVADYQGCSTLAAATSLTRVVDVGRAKFRNTVVFRGPAPLHGMMSSLD